MIRLFCYDELEEEVCVCTCDILSLDRISREEKTRYAEFLVNNYKENHPEMHGFHFEKEYSYFDENEAFDFFLSIAEEEEGLEGEEALEYAEAMFAEALKDHYDLGFDY